LKQAICGRPRANIMIIVWKNRAIRARMNSGQGGRAAASCREGTCLRRVYVCTGSEAGGESRPLAVSLGRKLCPVRTGANISQLLLVLVRPNVFSFRAEKLRWNDTSAPRGFHATLPPKRTTFVKGIC